MVLMKTSMIPKDLNIDLLTINRYDDRSIDD